MTDKNIRFRVQFNPQELQAANTAFDGLIKKAEALATALKGAGGGGGMLGGMNIGAGMPSPQSSLGSRGGGGGQKSSFTSVITANVDVFKKMAQEGGSAMKVMGDAVTRGIDQQKRSISGLNASMEALVGTYNKLGGAASGAMGEKIQNKIAKLQVKMSGLKKDLSSLEEVDAAKPGGPEGFWSKMTKSREMPGAAALGKSGVGQLLGGLGISPGMLGAIPAIAVGAWGAKGIYNEIVNQPYRQLGNEVRQGQYLARNQMDLRGGEFRNLAAERDLLQDSQKRESYDDVGSGWRRFGHSAGAFLKFNWDDAFSDRAADQGVAENRRKMVEQQRETDPVLDAIRGDVQNYRGTLAGMRSMGVYARPLETGFEALTRHRLAYSSFDDGEISAAFQGISGTGTRAQADALQGYAMHAAAAGIGGAAGSIGTMSKFGGGNAFANAMLNQTGGVDASTVDTITKYVAQQQDKLGLKLNVPEGQFQGQGLQELLLRGTSNTEGGRLRAEQNIRGINALQADVSGQSSPYQLARNYMIASEVAPGLNQYGQGMLATGMSMTELVGAASGKGGGVSGVFEALGGSSDMAKEYLKGVQGSLLEGVSAQGLEGTSSGKLMADLQASGMTAEEYFKSKQYKKIGFSKESKAVEALAGAYKAGDESMDASTALSKAQVLAGVGSAPGKGSKMVQSGLPELDAANAALKILADQAKGAGGGITDFVKSMMSAAEINKYEATHRGMSEAHRQKARDLLLQDPTRTGQALEDELDRQAQAALKKQIEIEKNSVQVVND